MNSPKRPHRALNNLCHDFCLLAPHVAPSISYLRNKARKKNFTETKRVFMLLIASPMRNRQVGIMRYLSQSALLTVVVGTSLAGWPSAWAADKPQATASLTDKTSDAQVPIPAQPPTVTVGPVYAYGPVLQAPTAPRQRTRRPDWGNRDQGRNDGMRRPSPYRNYDVQGLGRPWQSAPPRTAWNPGWNNYRYGGYRTQARPPYTNGFAWYDRDARQYSAQERYRQPYWRY
jgi:hypothetical protein